MSFPLSIVKAYLSIAVSPLHMIACLEVNFEDLVPDAKIKGRAYLTEIIKAVVQMTVADLDIWVDTHNDFAFFISYHDGHSDHHLRLSVMKDRRLGELMAYKAV